MKLNHNHPGLAPENMQGVTEMTYKIRGYLTGLSRGWFQIYRMSISTMEMCIQYRYEGRHGILVDDDYYALHYQIANYRKERASMALVGSGCLASYPAQDYEDAKILGAKRWESVFQSKRKRYKEAKQKLKEKR